MITLIACMDMNNGIGDENNNLLFNLPKDMQRFKSATSGKVVVMGRKTWESLPKRPLEKRKNYVLTRDKNFSVNGAKVVNSIDEVVKLGKTHDVYIIGGGEIYTQFLPYADRMMLTHVHVLDGKARVFFPDYEYKEWKIVSDATKKYEVDENHEHSFTFATYMRTESKN